MKMYCVKCGTKMNDTDKFCASCGTAAAPIDAPKRVITAAPTPAPQGWANASPPAAKPSGSPEKSLGTVGQKISAAFIENGRLKLLAIKSVQVGLIFLVGSVALTLLKYAGLSGGLPAVIVFLPIIYAVIHVLKPLSKAWGCAVVVAAFAVMFVILLAFIYVAELFGW